MCVPIRSALLLFFGVVVVLLLPLVKETLARKPGRWEAGAKAESCSKQHHVTSASRP